MLAQASSIGKGEGLLAQAGKHLTTAVETAWLAAGSSPFISTSQRRDVRRLPSRVMPGQEVESVSRRGGAGLGACVPIVLPSRGDDPRAHTVSCALALL